MKLNKQMWLIIAIILVGIAAAGFILKADKPKVEAGHGDHAEHAEEEAGDHAEESGGKDEHADHAEEGAVEKDTIEKGLAEKRPEHGEAGHNHEKDHMALSTNEKAVAKNTHGEHAKMSQFTKGPRGGKLFTEGNYAVEVTIFEQNQPPQFRLYTYLNGKPIAPTSTTVTLKLSRLGREAQTFKFTPENDYLVSKVTVEEPHSFKVDIDATYAGKAYEFGYDQVEARVKLTAQQLKQSAIEILTAGPANIQSNLRLLGEIKLNTDKAVQVLPRLAGIVESVAGNVGDKVTKGQTLAVVSSVSVAENRGDLAAAQQRLSLAKTTLLREETLWREKISAEQDYLAAKNEVQLAQIEVSRQQQKLSSQGIGGGTGTRYTLTSPIDGVITRKQISMGQVIDMSQMVFEVANLSTVWADVNIPTKDLGLVKVGQKVTVRAAAFDLSTEGTITYIAPLVAEQSRTATARVVLVNDKANWLVGLPVNIDLTADVTNVPLAVSLEAIQSIQYGNVVFGRYGDNFEARPVELGRRDSKYVEVLSGLNEGEQYAAGNSFIVKAELGKAGASHDH
ncbi:MAG: efflux RND transporter periplasmic adaptor subunit [Methylotenera sp.]|nr:efflux RND transporter periplasmic adaptor subunit [Methylotenera sp.]